MPNLVINIRYNYADELQLSVSELMNEWLFGIPLRDSFGNPFPIASVKKKILQAQKIVEHLIGFKISPTQIDDRLDYISEEFKNWGHLKLTYVPYRVLPQPDDANCYLAGYYNQRKVISYPKDWISVRGKNSSLIPGTSGASTIIVAYAGSAYPTLLQGFRHVPDFFHISYMTGFTEMPYDVSAVIGKMSAIFVAGIVGDVLFPVGISSQSLSIDGVSQSFSSILNSQGNLLAPKMNQYWKELFDPNTGMLQMLYNVYRGILFDTL